jgi:hypothetical protein
MVPIDKTKSESPIELGVLTGLVALVVIGSNPLYVLSYFTESSLLPTMDAVVSIIVIVSVAVACVVFLDRSHADQIDLNWHLIRAAPFVVTGVLFVVTVIFRGITTSASRVLVYMKAAGATACFLRIVIALLTYRPERQIRSVVMATMFSITFIVCLVSEVFCVVEPYIASSHEVHIFTFASVATYVFFLVRFYWPADPSQCPADELSSSENDQRLEPLDQ